VFEKVLEGLAGIVGARRWSRRSPGGLRVGSGRRIFFDGHPELVKRAVVACIFGRNALTNWLRAFKLRAGIKKAALLAAMQFELALRTFAVGIETGSEDGATIGTAGARDRSDHARGAGPELIGTARAAGRRLLVVRTLALLTLLRIAVTAMTILT